MPSPHLKIERSSVLLGSDHAPSCLQEELLCSSRQSCWLVLNSQRSGNHSQHCSLSQILQGPSSPRNHPLCGHPFQQHFLPWDPPQDPLRLPPQSWFLVVPPLDLLRDLLSHLQLPPPSLVLALALEMPSPAAFWIGRFLGGKLDVDALMVGVTGVSGWGFSAGWDLRAASLGETRVGIP
ncbi:hypothetical protein PIB30_070298 [Stylosanthes scabra]|uniref:Uncharacterized protein n=1 Tax=Stylosanthes scabra TaxID=79078 RepID=A0ABU6RNZ3_9FABA|nr:hypothetical protein [Stylosanthes scabra]